MNNLISAVILTKNEESNIERCLESLLWCDEIIVIDDYSQDETIRKIKELKSKIKKKLIIYERNSENDFSSQRNFGLEKAKNEWVLFVDADEAVSAELKTEIIAAIQSHAIAEECMGYYIKRQDYFLGKWLKYGETGNIKLLRLAKKGRGIWKGTVHELWDIHGQTGILENPLLHFPHPDIMQFLKKINFYTDLLAESWHKEKKEINIFYVLIYPLGKFVQNYFFRLGVLDGIQGLILAVMMSFHSFLARSKYFLMKNKQHD